MAFCNAYIKKPARETPAKLCKPGPVRHRRGNRHNVRIPRGFRAKHLPEHICVAVFLLFIQCLSAYDIKGADPVKFIRRFFRRGIAFPFLRHNM